VLFTFMVLVALSNAPTTVHGKTTLSKGFKSGLTMDCMAAVIDNF
jgi:hypothetical protein